MDGYNRLYRSRPLVNHCLFRRINQGSLPRRRPLSVSVAPSIEEKSGTIFSIGEEEDSPNDYLQEALLSPNHQMSPDLPSPGPLQTDLSENRNESTGFLGAVGRVFRRSASLPVFISGYAMNSLREKLHGMRSSRIGGLNTIAAVEEEDCPGLLPYPRE